MYQYRHILVRMRMGDSNRAIADSGVAGRNKVKAIKRIALEHGWLELDKDLPDDTQLAAIFGEKPPNPTTTSSECELHHHRSQTLPQCKCAS